MIIKQHQKHQKHMDYEDIIKLEQQSPIYSTGNNPHSPKHCMASFYDQDSEFDRREPYQQNQFIDQLSFEKAIDYVQNYVDIIDTPLKDIVNFLDRLQCADGLDRVTLEKRIMKRKIFLKRYRAKNRQPRIVCYQQQFPIIATNNGIESEAQIKKKRNRVSAQISRDRKKQYFKELQEKNQKLEEEIIRTRLENEKLKKQIQDTSKPKSKFFSDTLNNKLTRLLIFLGIICLIGMLKDSFFSAGESLSKIKMSSKIEDIKHFASSHQASMIEEGQRKIAQFLEESELQQELSDNEQRKISFQIDSPCSESSSKRYNIFSNLIERLGAMKQSIQMKNYEL